MSCFSFFLNNKFLNKILFFKEKNSQSQEIIAEKILDINPKLAIEFLDKKNSKHFLLLSRCFLKIEEFSDSILFAKKFMQKYNIPTGHFRSFNLRNISEAKKYLQSIDPPFVIKADGLAAGKGVFICDKLSEASNIINDIVVNEVFAK